jgi:hypothetical protein
MAVFIFKTLVTSPAAGDLLPCELDKLRFDIFFLQFIQYQIDEYRSIAVLSCTAAYR